MKKARKTIENRSQKKIFIILAFILISIINVNAQIDIRTQNQIKAKFLTAQELYDKKDYVASLEKVNEIEELTGGQLLAAAQNLKVKCLVGQRKYIQAKDELYTLEGLKLSNDILKDISSYSYEIEKFDKAERARAEKQAKELELLIRSAVFDSVYGGYGRIGEYPNYGMIDANGTIVVPTEYPLVKIVVGKCIVMTRHPILLGKHKITGEDVYEYMPNQDLYKDGKLIISDKGISLAMKHVFNGDHYTSEDWSNVVNVNDFDADEKTFGAYSLKLGEWILEPSTYQQKSNLLLLEGKYIEYFKSAEHSEKFSQGEAERALLDVSKYL